MQRKSPDFGDLCELVWWEEQVAKRLVPPTTPIRIEPSEVVENQNITSKHHNLG
jgi:hypothetical protein